MTLQRQSICHPAQRIPLTDGGPAATAVFSDVELVCEQEWPHAY